MTFSYNGTTVNGPGAEQSADGRREGLPEYIGVKKLEGFSLGAFFAEVFKSHSTAEVEDVLCAGTHRTTPAIADVDVSWPRPWIFGRTMLAALVLYAILRIGFAYNANANFLPGIIVVGTIAVPLSCLMLFFETNVRRNVSLLQVLKLFLLGGALSLVFAILLFDLLGQSPVFSPLQQLFSGRWQASDAGLVEEAMKLLALLVVARSARYPYRLNGLLLGAAVGTGFAVFESMGYAFRNLQTKGGGLDVDTMLGVITLRGLLAPFGHIVWTAITGYAFWREKGPRPFAFNMLLKGKFLALATLPVGMHILWNAQYGFPGLGGDVGFYAKFAALGVFAWMVVFLLIQDGLNEIRAEKFGKVSV